MIALEPDLEKILKAAVFGHFTGWQVAMVVEDGLVLGVLMVQPLRGFIGQQEIVVDERHRI
jgi:hypothetical protein